MTTPAVLALEDGTVFRGVSIGAAGTATGEVVFNTAMTGYQEILTDPSYSRQIVTLTYPHIGNTGTNPDDHESNLVHAAGLVIRDLPLLHSSWRATESLPEFLRRRNTVAIAEIDTRKLTRILREKGAQAGCIASGDAAARPDLAVRGGTPLSRAQGHGPGQGGLHRAQLPVERGHQLVARAGSAPPRRAATARGGLRFRHQAQHPAPARRPRLPHDGGARADHGRRGHGAGPGRRLPLQRPGRSGALHLRHRRDRASSSPTARRCSASASVTRSWAWPSALAR